MIVSKSFTKIALLMVLLSASVALTAQSWTREDYQKYTVENFRQYSGFNRTFSMYGTDYMLLDAAIFYLTNEQRVRNGLPVLPYHERLEIAAFNHSYQMAVNNFFSHTNTVISARASTELRGQLAGMLQPKLAENIAYNYPDNNCTYLQMADKLVTQWMNSSGHRANILSKSGMQMACGTYCKSGRVYGTQNFQWFYAVREDANPPKDKGPWDPEFGSSTYTPPSTQTNTTTTNSTTTTTAPPKATTEIRSVYAKKKQDGNPMLSVMLGGSASYALGATDQLSTGHGLDAASYQWHGMLGWRGDHRSKATVIGAFVSGGHYGSVASERMHDQELEASFLEVEAGFLFAEHFRLSGGRGTTSYTDSELFDDYWLATIGYYFGKKAVRFQLKNTVVFDEKLALRPSLGMALYFKAIKRH